MKKLQFLFVAFLALFRPRNEPHRVCWRCKKLIKRREKYHHIRVGWFSPVFTVEHRDCKNPTMLTTQEIVQQLGPELPFPDHEQDRKMIHETLGFYPETLP